MKLLKEIILILSMLIAGSTKTLFEKGEAYCHWLFKLVAFHVTVSLSLFVTGFCLAARGERHDMAGAWFNWAAFVVLGLFALGFVAIRAMRTSKAELPKADETPKEEEQDEEDELPPSLTGPLVAFLALAIATIAECVNQNGGVVTGMVLIGISEIILVTTMLVFWVRYAFLGTLFVLALSAVPDAFHLSADKPRQEMKNIGKMLAVAMSIFASLCMVTDTLPVWKYPKDFNSLFIGVAALAFMSLATWTDGLLVKRVLPILVGLRVVMLLVIMASPQVRVFLLGNPIDQYDAQLSTRMLQEQDAIKKRAVEQCGGEYCTEAVIDGLKKPVNDALRFAALEKKNAAVLNGTHWTSQRVAAQEPPATPTDHSAKTTDARDLPPPPAEPSDSNN